MDLESSKILGGIGALLLVIGGVGFFGNGFVGLLGLVGIILVLIALKRMSDYYKEAGIFNNALYAVILVIIGIVAFIGAIVGSFLAFLPSMPDWARAYINAGDWTGFATAFREHALADISFIWPFVGAAILSLVVLFIFAVVAMIFFRKSLNSLSAKTGVGLFGTAGLLMLIGAVLTVVLIGFLLIWIAWILLIVAFFSIRTQVMPQPTPQPAPQPSPQ